MNTNNKQRLVDFLDELIAHIKSDTLTDIQSRKLGEFYISMVNNTYETEEEKNIKYYMLGYHIYKNLLNDIL
jgi:hypothetical protein